MPKAKKKLQNQDIALRLNIHPVSLSRLRNGYRKPSVELMATIEQELGWPMAEQIKLYRSSDRFAYGTGLRKFMKDKFDIPAFDGTDEEEPVAP